MKRVLFLIVASVQLYAAEPVLPSKRPVVAIMDDDRFLDIARFKRSMLYGLTDAHGDADLALYFDRGAWFVYCRKKLDVLVDTLPAGSVRWWSSQQQRITVSLMVNDRLEVISKDGSWQTLCSR